LYLLRAKKKHIKVKIEKYLIATELPFFSINFLISKINNPKIKADKNFIEIKILVT